MGSIVEWQSLKMQEYRFSIMLALARFFEIFGIHPPSRLRQEPLPIPAGDYDHALHVDHPEAPSLLAQYLEKPDKPHAGDPPEETDHSEGE
jgi:hypothetical protein